MPSLYRGFFQLPYLLLFIMLLTVVTFIYSASTVYQSTFAQTEKNGGIQVNGFGGNNPEDKMKANINNSILKVGEIDNFDSTANGLKILVSIKNISNILNLDNNITKNLFLKIQDQPTNISQTDYLAYQFKESDFKDKNNMNKDILFLFYSGLIKDGDNFTACIYNFEIYEQNITCKSGTNTPGSKQEKIEFNIPKIINIDSITPDTRYTNNTTNNFQNNNTISMKSVNIHNFDNITLKSDIYDDNNLNLEVANSINRLLLINTNDDFDDKYLTQINISDIQNYTKTKISGHNVLDIGGFKFNEKDNKIYAFGDYHYLKGDPYDVRFGLAPKYHDHSLFVIDPSTSKIIDSVKLWSAEEEGDETTIGNLFINYNSNELYITASDEGELDDIYVLDSNTLEIKFVVPMYNTFGINFEDNVSYDSSNDTLFVCSDNSILGLNIDDKIVRTQNFSSVDCPDSVSSKTHTGYFMDHWTNTSGIINMTNGEVLFLLKDESISSGFISDHDNNTVILVGHEMNLNDSRLSCASNYNNKDNVDSYIIRISIANGSVISKQEFDNVYLHEVIENPSNGNLYGLTTEVESDPYSDFCYYSERMYDLSH